MASTTRSLDTASRTLAGTARNAMPVPPRPAPLDSAEILRGQTAVEISHNGLLYRLQATRLGKLILTK
jgi:hemin uptake protein HemP